MHALLRLMTFAGIALFARAIVREARSTATPPRLAPPKRGGRAATRRKRPAKAASDR